MRSASLLLNERTKGYLEYLFCAGCCRIGNMWVVSIWTYICNNLLLKLGILPFWCWIEWFKVCFVWIWIMQLAYPSSFPIYSGLILYIFDSVWVLCPFFLHKVIFCSNDKNYMVRLLLCISISQYNLYNFLLISSFIIYFHLYFSPFSFFFLVRKNIFVPKLNENQSMIW